MKTPWILFGLLALASASGAQSPLRVACVGDSITFGSGISDRGRHAYPAVLERLSEGRFVTGNFGVSGTTALQSPLRAWTKTRAYRDALGFAPDIVVIMLGINDLHYPGLHDHYPVDLRHLVERFQALRSAPRVFLCTLTPIAPEDHQIEANRLIRHTMNPAIRDVAAQTGARIIDISAAFPNRLDLLPDGLHPNPEGAELIARTVLAALEEALDPAPAIQTAPSPGPPELSIRHEAVAAMHRAETWQQDNPPPGDLPDPASVWDDRTLRTPEDTAPLLSLLDGRVPDGTDDVFFAYAALAAALDRIGHETVFLAPDRPMPWREALAHQIIQRQRIDAAGRGFWGDPGDDAPRATAHALQALATALGLSSSGPNPAQ